MALLHHHANQLWCSILWLCNALQLTSWATFVTSVRSDVWRMAADALIRGSQANLW